MQILLNNFIAISKTCLKNNLILINARNFSAAAKYHETKEIPQQEQLKKGNDKEEVQGHRALHIAVIGVPNAGKSTFINNLINHRVCPTSSKVHTTRKANTAICTTGDTQLVFYDTPGLVTQREIKKHHLEQSFKSAYRHAVQHADIIAVMQDVTNSWTRKELHSTVIDTLKAYPNLPSFLILNKIDALKSKRILLDLIGTLTNNTLSGRDVRRHRQKKSKPETSTLDKTSEEDSNSAVGSEPKVLEFHDLHKREVSWNNFSDVFMVSSITGSGLNDIQDYLVNNAKERSWKYPAETFTDETPESLIVDSVRARLLDYLPQEIPYNLKSVIEYYSEENNTIYASVQVICPTARIERLICGESNGKLRQITERVTSDLVETFGKPISLTIATMSKKEKD